MKKNLILSFATFLVLAFGHLGYSMDGMEGHVGAESSSGGFDFGSMLHNVKYGVGVQAVGNFLTVNDVEYDYGFGGQVLAFARMSYVEPYVYLGWATAKEKEGEDASDDEKEERVSLNAPYGGVGLKVNAGLFSMVSPYIHLSASFRQVSFEDEVEDGLDEKYYVYFVEAGAGLAVFVNDQLSVDIGYSNLFYSGQLEADEDYKDGIYDDVEYRGHKAYVGFSAYM